MPPGPRRHLVVTPTVDERDNVNVVVPALLARDLDVLVVDDGSTDGTQDAVRALAGTTGRVHLLARARRLGLGTAYRDGFTWGLERGYERIVQMDADRSHDPADVPRLVALLDDCDVAVGSRYLPGARCVGWPYRRWLLSRVAGLYVRPILGLSGLTDPMGGFKAYRAGALRAVRLPELTATGYVFQAEILHRAIRTGQRVRELPITFHERVAGTSKMTTGIIVEAMVRPFTIRRRARHLAPPTP